MFLRSHVAGEILKRQQSPVMLDLCLRRTRAVKSHDYHYIIVWKISILKMFSVHIKTQSRGVFKLLGLKECFPLKIVRFRDGLVWTEDLSVEIKLRFQISLA